MRFGERLRQLRENRGLLLRELAALVEIDTALLSKIERSNRVATRQQVISFAKAFKMESQDLEKLWLADQVVQLVKNETNAADILELAQNQLDT